MIIIDAGQNQYAEIISSMMAEVNASAYQVVGKTNMAYVCPNHIVMRMQTKNIIITEGVIALMDILEITRTYALGNQYVLSTNQ